MKTRFFVYLIIFGFSRLLLAGVRDENLLLFEFKKQVTCDTAKLELSSYKIEIECDRVDLKKKRFFGGHYLGKKPVLAVVAELKKNTHFASVAQNTSDFRTDP